VSQYWLSIKVGNLDNIYHKSSESSSNNSNWEEMFTKKDMFVASEDSIEWGKDRGDMGDKNAFIDKVFVRLAYLCNSLSIFN
jgi:hypothetical protein